MKDRHNPQPFDWLILLLLMTMALIGAWALTATEWAEDLNLIPLIALVAVWAGTALARSRFPGWLAAVFAIAYGLFIIGWQLGSTLDPALIWQRKLLVLYGRIAVFGSTIIVGEPNKDPLMFVLIMCLVSWVVGAVSAWGAVRKNNLWMAVLPGALTIIAIAYYYLGEVELGLFLGVYLFLALILAVRMELNQHQSQWLSARARVPMDFNLRISISGFIAAALLVILAWGVPAFARSERLAEVWAVISRPLETIKERFGDAIGTVHGPATVVATEYDDVLQLGAGTQPLNRLVMTVSPGNLPRGSGRFYWRSRVYDRYSESQWFSPQSSRIEFDPTEGNLPGEALRGREMVELSFAPETAAFRQLYLPSEPVWVDRSAEAVVSAGEQVNPEVFQIYADLAVYPGEAYLARSSIASPTASQLRQAGEEYPDGVTNQYLQLPDSITGRMMDLAEEIAADLDSPYDKTVAVTRWLRSHISYNRVTEAPPPEAEPLDWFLFDYRIGFCNYYASAEVVLLRILGIPARLAAGYARGTYHPDQMTYEVLSEDSHSWPEVYFPEYGWVEFEPTLSQPVLTRPETLEEADPGGGFRAGPDGSEAASAEDRLEGLLDPNAEIPQSGGVLGRTSRVSRILFFAGLGLLMVLGWIRVNPSTWIGLQTGLASVIHRVGLEAPARLRPAVQHWPTPTGRRYAAWSAWLRRLGLAASEAETPRQRLALFRRVMPAQSDQADILVDAYMRERFADEAVDETAVKGAWRGLAGRLWLTWVWSATARWREDSPPTRGDQNGGESSSSNFA